MLEFKMIQELKPNDELLKIIITQLRTERLSI